MHSVIEFSSQQSHPGFDPNNCLLHDELASRFVATEYPRGKQLCSECEPAKGIFSICTGETKEYITSPGGKTAIVRILHPGDVVGLEAVLGDSTYETTVEAIEPTTAHFIPTREILSLMRSDENFRLAVARQLSNRCRCAYHEIRQFGLAVPARVARFLLDLTGRTELKPIKVTNLSVNLTREEIAQSIGSSRETVSRIVTFLQRKRWILINGKQWRIQNRQRLAAMAREQGGFATDKLSLYAA